MIDRVGCIFTNRSTAPAPKPPGLVRPSGYCGISCCWRRPGTGPFHHRAIVGIGLVGETHRVRSTAVRQGSRNHRDNVARLSVRRTVVSIHGTHKGSGRVACDERERDTADHGRCFPQRTYSSRAIGRPQHRSGLSFLLAIGEAHAQKDFSRIVAVRGCLVFPGATAICNRT